MIPRLFLPRRAALRTFAWLALWPLPWAVTSDPVITVVVGAIAALAMTVFWTVRSDEPTLDASLAATPAHAAWMAICAVLVAIVAQVEHRHGRFAFVGPAIGAAGAVLAAISFVASRRLGRWIDRAYRGEDPHLRVRATSDDVRAPRLSRGDGNDAKAAIVEGTTHDAGPYRAGEGRLVARVPVDPTILRRRYARQAIVSAIATLACIASIVVALPTIASRAHRDDFASTPTKLPALPGECHDKRIKLRFVALAPLSLVDIDDVAARYAATSIGDVVVEEALPFEDAFFDPERHQVVGEAILRAARARYGTRKNELVMVVTDRDMFLREVEWRFAFATRETGIAVVSIARMDPHFPLIDPHAYSPRRGECSATVRARGFRMMTRQVLLGLCSAGTLEDPRSARRRTVMGLSDLDAVDEATY